MLHIKEEEAGTVTQHDDVQTGFLPGTTFPLVVRPDRDGIDAVSWARDNRSFITGKLERHGALLFRDFDLPEIADFERFAEAVCPNLYGEYGDLPRAAMGEKIYGTTPYPPDQTILFHNESSHMTRWPMKQFFYCITPPKERGETVIVDCRVIYDQLDEQVIRPFRDKKLMYVRNFVEGLDVSWEEFFKTDDTAEVEKRCRETGMECEWTEDGLRLRQRALAVARHPKTSEMVFFNQLQLHHVSKLDPEVRESLEMLYGEEGLPRNVYYGDGSPIDDALVAEIERLYWDNAVAHRWQPRDVILVDNMLVSHARNPYVEPRKIVVAMGELISKEEVEAE